MNMQENKEFTLSYLESLSGKPNPPEFVDQYVAKQTLRNHIAIDEAAFPDHEFDLSKNRR